MKNMSKTPSQIFSIQKLIIKKHFWTINLGKICQSQVSQKTENFITKTILLQGASDQLEMPWIESSQDRAGMAYWLEQ